MKSFARWLLREEIAREREARSVAEQANIELRRRIYEPETPLPVATGRNPPTPERLASYLALLTFTATIVFGLTWMTYRRTYGTFGLTPDEVGLDYGTVLSRAAPGFGVIAVLAVLSWTAWRLFTRLSAEVDTPATGIRDVLVGAVAAEFMVATYFLLSGGTLPLTFLWYFVLAALVELVSLAVVGAYRVGSFRYRQLVRSADKAVGKVTKVLRAPSALAVLIVLLFTPGVAGANLANILKSGGTLPSRLDPALVDAKMVDVEVYWVSGNQPNGIGPFDHPGFLYLGQRGDRVILYEQRNHQILRVSSQNIVMQSYSLR